MGLFYFKERKPRQFEYKPYFYNPEKEEFDERIRRIKKEIGINDESVTKQSYKPNKALSFKKQYTDSVKTPKVKLLIIVIAFVLIVVMFYLIGVYTSYIIKNV